ncbi:MAG: c-type cytochrome [Oligoflexia bacterium]|nr:c-type cytochrome [Oligoflexia bacterium]
MKKAQLLIYTLLLLASSCSYRVDKQEVDLASNLKNISFAEINQMVFQPKCARCHGGDIFSNYTSVLENLDFIKDRILRSERSPGAMPPSGKLKNEEINAILAWMADGAPEFKPGETTPQPQPIPPRTRPSPEELENPTYQVVNQFVFQLKCSRCHGRGLVKDYESVLASLDAINLEVSQGSMPPFDATQLTEEEKNLLLRWIALGAPNN